MPRPQRIEQFDSAEVCIVHTGGRFLLVRTMPPERTVPSVRSGSGDCLGVRFSVLDLAIIACGSSKTENLA